MSVRYRLPSDTGKRASIHIRESINEKIIFKNSHELEQSMHSFVHWYDSESIEDENEERDFSESYDTKHLIVS